MSMKDLAMYHAMSLMYAATFGQNGNIHPSDSQLLTYDPPKRKGRGRLRKKQRKQLKIKFMKTSKKYVHPIITIKNVKIENGYGLSIDHTIMLGTENMSEGSTLNFGVSENSGEVCWKV